MLSTAFDYTIAAVLQHILVSGVYEYYTGAAGVVFVHTPGVYAERMYKHNWRYVFVQVSLIYIDTIAMPTQQQVRFFVKPFCMSIAIQQLDSKDR